MVFPNEPSATNFSAVVGLANRQDINHQTFFSRLVLFSNSLEYLLGINKRCSGPDFTVGSFKVFSECVSSVTRLN